MTILQIETATTVCSVALAKDGEVIAVKELNERNIHAEVITLYIDEILKSAGLRYTDIDAVAVSAGPGSYTGLRIGISTAKGLCYAIDKPLVAVETLVAMAQGILAFKDAQIDSETLLCPMIDARRMEVYTALFDAKGNRVKPTAAEIVDEHTFAEILSTNKVLFFGDGAEKCKTVIGDNLNAMFAADLVNSATQLTKLAAAKFAAGNFENVAYYEPFYLKDFLVTTKKNA